MALTTPQTPWVQFQTNTFSALVSTPTTIIDEALNTLVIVDSLQVTNTFRRQIFLDIMVVRPTFDSDTGNLTQQPYYYARNYSLSPYESTDLLKEKTLYLQPRQMLGSNNVTTGGMTSLGIGGGLYQVIATTIGNHNLVNGSFVCISGATPDVYNGFYIVQVISPTKFTYTLNSLTVPTTPATGTIKVQSYIPGDTLIVNSDAFDHQFDCIASYRQMTPPLITLTSLTSLISANISGAYVATAVTAVPLSLTTGMIVLIQNTYPTAYNGFYVITNANTTATSTTFTYTLPSDPGVYIASGTPQIAIYNPS